MAANNELKIASPAKEDGRIDPTSRMFILGIPTRLDTSALRSDIEKFGDVEVYLCENCAGDNSWAFVGFTNREAVDRLLQRLLYRDDPHRGGLELAGLARLRRRRLALLDGVRQVLNVRPLHQRQKLPQTLDEAAVHAGPRRRGEEAVTHGQRRKERLVRELQRHDLRRLVVHALDAGFRQRVGNVVGVLSPRHVGRDEGQLGHALVLLRGVLRPLVRQHRQKVLVRLVLRRRVRLRLRQLQKHLPVEPVRQRLRVDPPARRVRADHDGRRVGLDAVGRHRGPKLHRVELAFEDQQRHGVRVLVHVRAFDRRRRRAAPLLRHPRKLRGKLVHGHALLAEEQHELVQPDLLAPLRVVALRAAGLRVRPAVALALVRDHVLPAQQPVALMRSRGDWNAPALGLGALHSACMSKGGDASDASAAATLGRLTISSAVVIRAAYRFVPARGSGILLSFFWLASAAFGSSRAFACPCPAAGPAPPGPGGAAATGLLARSRFVAPGSPTGGALATGTASLGGGGGGE
ncbi:RNA-binding protein, putative [Babesia caballi]|uniref:RNA-binding protein, putative n=1 Tax=Babesia caballi TaxID=5871 RepID=A0AAV4M1K4_BABCB|nr:RNA-binding protein, putative [Babesia caballi]